MKFVLSSTNKAKVEATKQVLGEIFSDLELVTVDVVSGVSKTPDSDDEGISGCLNRIEEAKRLVSDADGYIGLEGIITRNSYGTFICGWCVILYHSKRGIGCSAKVQLPDSIAREVSSFKELSALVKEVYPSTLTSNIDVIGTNGIITNMVYTRVDEFVDAIKCASGGMAMEKDS